MNKLKQNDLTLLGFLNIQIRSRSAQKKPDYFVWGSRENV